MIVQEDRSQIWDEYLASGGQDHRIVKHMFVDYTRYHEAALISEWFINNKIKLDFPILDYGCGVGDYGIYLVRQGANVSFYDFPRSTELVDYRLKREGLKGTVIDADQSGVVLQDYDLMIFGEVLEHLKNPLEVLTEANLVPYIFTSSYPYRTDDPYDPYWNNHDHDDRARLQQPLCRELLETNYDYVKFDGELRLWIYR